MAAYPDGDLLHVTPPYNFTATMVSTTAAISLIDQRNQKYVGQVLIDVDTTRILKRLTPEETPLLASDGFHTLITTARDQFEFNTIVGPDFVFGVNYSSIEDLLMRHDNCDAATNSRMACENRREFEKILERKISGDADTVTFRRTKNEDGDEQETIYYSFAPVEVTSFRAVDASNASRGVYSFKSYPYVLGIGETEQGLYSTFETVEGPLNNTVKISIAVVSVSIIIAFCFVAFISSRVALSITIPVTQLLSLVRSIRRSEINEDMPEIRGGSREVSKVNLTFERLYMAVRFANSAFFSGDLVKAYERLSDALELFTKLNNPKAISVANNNLGNTMLTMYRSLTTTGAPNICGMTKERVIEKGTQHFNSCIDAGEHAIERINQEEGWSTNYLIFMQQLSNRYFNRAMFLLTVEKDHPSPTEAKQQGLMDLSTARDMDREVVDNGDQQGFKGDRDVHFDLLISRIKGILQLIHIGHPDEWGVDELIDDARKELVEALKDPNDMMFRTMEPAGQMQRLDAVLIEYYQISDKKDQMKAAEVAIRMLFEDDYVIGTSANVALKTLTEYVDLVSADELGGEDPSNVKAALYRLRNQTGESLSLIHHGRDVMGREMFRQSNVGDLSMEVF